MTLGALLLVPGLAIAKELQQEFLDSRRGAERDADAPSQDDIELPDESAAPASEDDGESTRVDEAAAETASADVVAIDDAASLEEDQAPAVDQASSESSPAEQVDATEAAKAEGVATAASAEAAAASGAAGGAAGGLSLSSLLLGGLAVGGIVAAATRGSGTKDLTPPTGTISLSDTALRTGETSIVTITFSEAVPALALSSFSVENGTLSNLQSLDGGRTWTATFTPTANLEDTTNIIAIAAGAITDTSGNKNTGAIQSSNYAIDTKGPTATITLSDTALKIGETATVTITFSEAVAGFTNADLTVAGGTLTDVSSSDGGVTWTGTFTPTADLEDTTNLVSLATSYTDVAGNTGTAATSANYAIDTKGPYYSLAQADIDSFVSDTDFDSFVRSTIDAGYQGIELDPIEVESLGASGFTLDAGTDVLITGTGFLGATGVGPLLSAADVDVQLSQADLNSILANNGPGNDASFDALINSLEAAGMDRLVLDVGQVAALAADGITLDAGTDVLITGTGFLGATGVGPLLSAADVDVQLSETDLQWILAAGSAPAIDARLDELVAGLRGAGMDRLILDPGQVAALGAVGGVDFDFADDYSVLVTGTGFLSAPGVTTLLGNVNVDVQLSTSDLAGLFGASGGAQSALDSLVDSINSLDSGFVSLGTVTGDARLALDIGAVQALAAAGLDFGSTADVLVTGTGFLSAPAPLLAQVTELLDDANVTLGLSSADAAYLGSFATSDSFDLAIGSLESKMAAVDIDTLQFTSGDLAGLVDALSGSLGPSAVFDGFSTASGIDSVLVTGTGFLDQGSGTLDNLFDAYDTPSDVDGVSLDEQIVKLLGGHTPY